MTNRSGWTLGAWLCLALTGCGETVTSPPDGATADVSERTDAAVDSAVRDDAAAPDVPSCDIDLDGDGFFSVECGGNDCDDDDIYRYPGNVELCDGLLPDGRSAADHDEDCNPCTLHGAGTDGDADADLYPSVVCTNPWLDAEPLGCDATTTAIDSSASLVMGTDCVDNASHGVGVSRPATLPFGMGPEDIHPGLPEVCDEVDNDCSGEIDGLVPLYPDLDQDGRGDPGPDGEPQLLECDSEFTADNGEDCNDMRADIHLGAAEQCDGWDNDCRETPLEAAARLPEDGPFVPGQRAPYEDRDGDGYTSDAYAGCSGFNEGGATGSAFPRTDCNDAEESDYLGALEVCGDERDNNCNGEVDESRQTVCEDHDYDGHGAGAVVEWDQCELPSCAAREAAGEPCLVPQAQCSDCDDSNGDRFPRNTEMCDRIDSDCLGPADGSDEDQDGDGHAGPDAVCVGGPLPKDDCDETDVDIHPNATEFCDGVDSNCSGDALAEDADSDSYSSPDASCLGRGEPGAPGTAFPKTDCDDARFLVNPGRTALDDQLTCDGFDNDCNPATTELTEECPDGGFCAEGGTCLRGSEVVQVVVGSAATCSRAANGRVFCWGQWGSGSSDEELSPLDTHFSGATGISMGGSNREPRVCASLADGTVSCSVSFNPPTTVPGLNEVVQVAAGYEHDCVLIGGGQVWCWGDNGYGALGDGTTTDSANPVRVRVLPETIVSIDVGDRASAAISDSGQLYRWGHDGFEEESRTEPVLFAGTGPLVEVDTASGVTCALGIDRSSWCWGFGNNGNFGNEEDWWDQPFEVPWGNNFAVRAQPAGNGTCVIRGSDRWVECFGGSPINVGWDGNMATRAMPSRVPQTEDTQQFALDRHACALSNEHGLRCWGSNGSGQVGDGTTTFRNDPFLLSVAPRVTDLAISQQFGYAILSDGRHFTWGSNFSAPMAGQTPREVVPRPSFESVVGGGRNMCAVRSDSDVECWGDNDQWALGSNNPGDGRVVVSLPNPATRVALGSRHTCALVSGGVVHCWGSNQFGQLADVTRGAMYDVPDAAVPALTNVTEVGAAGRHSCAIVSGGGVRCWGDNRAGQLGLGHADPVSNVATIPGLTNMVALALGQSHSCSIDDAGAVWCWGSNDVGQLGRAASAGVSGPMLVAGASGATAIVAEGYTTCVMSEAGVARCWGANESGQVGDGTTDSPKAVTQVPNLPALAFLTRGFCGVTRESGAVRCWGRNIRGRFGDGTAVDHSTATTVWEL